MFLQGSWLFIKPTFAFLQLLLRYCWESQSYSTCLQLSAGKVNPDFQSSFQLFRINLNLEIWLITNQYW
jgi:hypothetical protein